MPLSVKNVSFTYPGAENLVLDNLSIEVAAGKIVALCGAARTGRSTVLELMAGLSEVTTGTVTVDGVDAAHLTSRGRVGLLLQNADEALFGLTVLDDVMFAAIQLGASADEARQTAQTALRGVHLDPDVFGPRSPFSLSGGQRRRAAIAGLMAMKPTYLLLDEPYVGLDPLGRSETADVIRSLSTRGFANHTGILVALSELDLALRLADSIQILHAGCIVWHGTVQAYIDDIPDVEQWGLVQPDLLYVAKELRQRGWEVPLQGIETVQIARAVASAWEGRA